MGVSVASEPGRLHGDRVKVKPIAACYHSFPWHCFVKDRRRTREDWNFRGSGRVERVRKEGG